MPPIINLICFDLLKLMLSNLRTEKCLLMFLCSRLLFKIVSSDFILNRVFFDIFFSAFKGIRENYVKMWHKAAELVARFL